MIAEAKSIKLEVFQEKVFERKIKFWPRIVDILLFYSRVASIIISIQQFYAKNAQISVGFIFAGIAIERFTSYIMLYNSISFTQNNFWKVLFCVVSILTYTDILSISWIKSKSFKRFKLLQNYRQVQKVAQNSMEMFTTLFVLSNVVFQFRIFANDSSSFQIIHASIILTCYIITSRTMIYYQRRCQSKRNFRFDCDYMKYEDLLKSQKDLIFFPKFCLLQVAIISHPKDYQMQTNYFYKSTLKLSVFQKWWIFLWIFIQYLTVGFSFAMMSMIWTRPLALKQENRYEYRWVLPVFLTVLSFIYMAAIVIRSRGHIFTIFKETKGFFQKIILFLLFFIGNAFDFHQPPREEIPFIWKIKEIKNNWFDNQLPGFFSYTFRLAVQFFMGFICQFIYFHIYEIPQSRKDFINSLWEVQTYKILFYINLAIYIVHYTYDIYHDIERNKQIYQFRKEIKEFELQVPSETQINHVKNYQINKIL